MHQKSDIVAMLKRRMPSEFRSLLDLLRIDTIGLLMLPVPDLYFYANLASKSANVIVSEIFFSYPQHITTLAIFGAVAAMRMIENDNSAF
ncbi:MAG: hypothetical protein ACSLEN_01235 [Candidatus Malihini olakiniferum]